MATGPRTVVLAPEAAAPRFGLLASILPTTNQGDRWLTGITYLPEGCGTGELFTGCETTPASDVSDFNKPDIVEWDAYFISVNEQCSTFSLTVSDVEARARRLLNSVQETLIGAEFWDGTKAQATAGSVNTWLADSSDPNFSELSNGTAVGLVHGLACLEEYLASNNGGQQGVIHATAQVVTHWESFRLLRREGNNILTFKDTLVIPSPGYSGTDPTGNIGDGNVWAYATDMPRIFLGPIEVYVQPTQAVDRAQNTVRVVAQRPALVEWQRCRHAGIQLAISLCGGGS